MLAVGRALMRKPRLLLLDEPTTGLAPMLAAVAYDALARPPRARPDDRRRRAAGAPRLGHRRSRLRAGERPDRARPARPPSWKATPTSNAPTWGSHETAIAARLGEPRPLRDLGRPTAGFRDRRRPDGRLDGGWIDEGGDPRRDRPRAAVRAARRRPDARVRTRRQCSTSPRDRSPCSGRSSSPCSSTTAARRASPSLVGIAVAAARGGPPRPHADAAGVPPARRTAGAARSAVDARRGLRDRWPARVALPDRVAEPAHRRRPDRRSSASGCVPARCWRRRSPSRPASPSMVFFRFATIGKAVRSVIQNEEGAKLCGINPASMRTLIFALSGASPGSWQSPAR